MTDKEKAEYWQRAVVRETQYRNKRLREMREEIEYNKFKHRFQGAMIGMLATMIGTIISWVMI